MARYEFVEGSSKKFWEIEVAGKEVTTKWGRIGTPGAFKTKTFPSPAAAQKEHATLVREKTTKGYKAVKAAKAKGGKAAREVTDAPQAMAGEPRMPSLEKTIRNDPDEDGPYTVYGDWLSEQGHPRGELVTAQVRGLTKQATKLLKQHPSLWGDLAELSDVVTDVTWENGFIAGAKVANTRDRNHEGDDPDRGLPSVEIADVVGMLLDGPGRFLRDLVVGIVKFESNTYEAIAAAIAKRGPLPTVRSLYLGDFRSQETELNWSETGDLSKLWKAVPNLETLRLRSGTIALDKKLDLPALRELSIYTGGLDEASAKAIASARWPTLVKLDLMFGRISEGAVDTARPLAALLEARAVPALRWLGLKNFGFHAELVPAILRSKVLKQLEVLDLSHGSMGDAEAELLVAGKAQLAHLDELVVADNYFTAKGLKLLKQVGVRITAKTTGKRSWDVNAHGQREVEDDEDDDRYASIYE